MQRYFKYAIENKIPIKIVGDYDVDGISASSIMFLTLEKLGANVSVRLPRRFSEGYGLSEKIVDEVENGLLITVDNGIAAIDAINKAKEKGLEVIVTDHHLPNEDGILPNADIIIDPHIEGTADFTDYCGAGIAYKISEKLINDEVFLKKMEALAAIGTICDMMPLVGDNRNIVKNGLKNIETKNTTLGLQILLEKIGLTEHIEASDIGFKVGPVLNAPGRLDDKGALLSLSLLTRDSTKYLEMATKYSDMLINKNKERKELVNNAMIEIETEMILNGKDDNPDFPMIIYKSGISEGIAGIIAGNLANKYDVPVFVFTDSLENGILKGSVRTGSDVHIKNLLDKCKSEDPNLFVKYGGHAEAAGISIKKDNLEKVKEELTKNCYKPLCYVKDDSVKYDLEITPDKVANTLKEMEMFKPFGMGNPEPIFLMKDFKLKNVPWQKEDSPEGTQLLGEHIKFFGPCDAIGFGMANEFKELDCPKSMNIVGKLKYNYYNGASKPQVQVEYIEKTDKEKDVIKNNDLEK